MAAVNSIRLLVVVLSPPEISLSGVRRTSVSLPNLRGRDCRNKRRRCKWSLLSPFLVLRHPPPWPDECRPHGHLWTFGRSPVRALRSRLTAAATSSFRGRAKSPGMLPGIGRQDVQPLLLASALISSIQLLQGFRRPSAISFPISRIISAIARVWLTSTNCSRPDKSSCVVPN